jgi:SH3-like domain-containing protein
MNGVLVRGSVAVLMLSAIVLIIFAGLAKAEPVAPGAEHCVVNVRSDDVLNMRERPSASSAVAARKRYGACGILVNGECRGSWCPVEDGHSLGWVHRHYISMVSPALYCVTGVAAGDRLNLRAYPSPQSRVLARLGRNQCGIAFLPYAVGGWQKIRVSGWEGWVNRRYLSGE